LICIKTRNGVPWLAQTRDDSEPGEPQMRRMHVWAMIALALATVQGQAQEIGQPGRGLALAQRLCAQCHAVQKGQARSPNAGAPRFQVIAAVPGMTSIALSAALNSSHRAMPNILLEADQQADIIAYILSLK
jgi:mono/diheme cytochrome c family protein